MEIRVGFNKNEPMTFEQAGNLVHEQSSRTEEEIRAWAKDVPGGPSTAPMSDKIKFLEYAISLCDGKQPLYTALLRFKLHLAATPGFETMQKDDVNKFIAYQLSNLLKERIMPGLVDKYEHEAILYVQEAIRSKVKTAIPIVGGL
jgi:hypothetical protein